MGGALMQKKGRREPRKALQPAQALPRRCQAIRRGRAMRWQMRCWRALVPLAPARPPSGTREAAATAATMGGGERGAWKRGARSVQA